MSELKKELYKLCERFIGDSLTTIKQKIADAQDAANDDTKSSAGDKYEVGREMMQQEIDLDLSRMAEVQKHKETLDRLLPEREMDVVQPGSLVYTIGANYYIAISAGKLLVNGQKYYAISSAAPVALLMAGKRAGDTFYFNGKTIGIERVA